MMRNISTKKVARAVFLRGEKVILRPLEEGDINTRYLSWLNDREVTRYMETRSFPYTMRELRRFYDEMEKSRTDMLLAITDKRNGLHIGNIKLGGINWVHRFGELGIMIGEKKYWGRGYGQEACTLLLKYAFEKLNMNKVFLGAYAVHESAIKAYQKAGFKVEGRIKDIFYFDGRYVDKIMMGISKDDFKKDA
jgi:RimJ/RimL family protein N-acetyltransferase